MEMHLIIGSKIKINNKEYLVIDIWEGDSVISLEENSEPEIFFANLRDNNGKIIGPIQINLNK